jgi:hypothetical protein
MAEFALSDWEGFEIRMTGKSIVRFVFSSVGHKEFRWIIPAVMSDADGKIFAIHFSTMLPPSSDIFSESLLAEQFFLLSKHTSCSV